MTLPRLTLLVPVTRRMSPRGIGGHPVKPKTLEVKAPVCASTPTSTPTRSPRPRRLGHRLRRRYPTGRRRSPRRVAAYCLTNDCRHPAGGRPSTALPKSRSTRLEGGPPGAPEIRSHFYPVEPVSTTTGAWAKIADALKDWPFWLCVALALSLTALVLTPRFYTLLRPTAGTAVQFAAVVAWVLAVCGVAAPIAAA